MVLCCRNTRRSFVVLALALAALTHSACAQMEYFVDPASGNDANPGTIDKPFANVFRARDMIRDYRTQHGGLPAGGFTVNLRGGTYYPPATTEDVAGGKYPTGPTLNLTAQDSGSPSSPIVYTAYNGESVRFLGGRPVPRSAWYPYKGKIMQANLTALGITQFGKYGSGSLGSCAHSVMELYFNGVPGVLARYPNLNLTTGYWNWDQIQSVVDPKSSFVYAGDRPSSWLTNPTPFWLHGYWSFGWADNYVKVAAVDIANKTFVISDSTPVLYGFKRHARYMAVNVLAELDQVNEYYIDFTSGQLYYYPPADLSDPASEVVLSVVTEPSILLTDVSFVTIDGVAAVHTQSQGLRATNVVNVTIQNCDFSSHSQHGASLSGYNSTLKNTKVAFVGCSAISVAGGDEQTLARGNNLVENCNVTSYARWKRTYQAGLAWSGVGNTYRNNSVSNSPHTGLIGGGNDNLFEDNHVFHMCYEVTDAGAWYSGRSWAKRGNIVRNNLWEDIQNHVPTYLGSPRVQAIYLDDELSDVTVTGNIIKDADQGILVGGGRHNTVTNNTFIRCGNSISLDDRGLTWQHSYCTYPNGTFFKELDALNYKHPPYSTHYPNLATIATDHPCTPVRNVLSDNRYCKSPLFNDFDPSVAVKDWYDTIANNVEFSDC